jgi:cytochrome-b5 reductase
VIKLYSQGKMSQILAALSVGDSMMMKGPKGRLQYTPNSKAELGMVAGGSGITPMYQVVNAILKNKADKTKVSLVFGNVTEEDILLRDELDQLARMHADRFRVHYILDKPPKEWAGSKGYITQEVVKANLPAPGPGVLMLRCGPTPMMEAMKRLLDGMGYSDEMQFQF